MDEVESDQQGVRRSSAQDLILFLDGPGEFGELYETREKIGQGAFGTVFACKDLQCEAGAGLQLCVKIVSLDRHRAFSKVRADESRELLVLHRYFTNPHVIRYHRFAQTTEALFIVMDRCCGADLVDHVSACGGLVSLDRARNLSLQILKAVAAVQSIHIMHRDIKLENFRFDDTRAQRLKLLDFGFAKPCRGFPSEHTVTGSLIYAAPEVLDGFYMRTCDLYSAGVVTYLLLCGRPPFESSDMFMLRSLHRDPVLTGSSLFRGSRWRHVPAIAQSLVRGLLSIDPRQRMAPEVAVEHEWFSKPATLHELEGDSDEPRASQVKRCPSSLAKIKRTYFLWDVASAVGDK